MIDKKGMDLLKVCHLEWFNQLQKIINGEVIYVV